MKQALLKIVTAFLGMLFIASSAVAQNFEFHWKQLSESSNRLEGKLTGTIYVLTPKSNSNYFLHDDWFDGSITLEDEDVFEDLKLRYQAFDDELVVYNNNLRNLFVIDKEKVKSFTVKTSAKNQKFVKYFFEGYPKGDRYFEVLYDGQRKMLAYHEILEEKTRPYVDQFGIMKDTYFRLNTNYYMYSPEIGFQRIRLRRASLLNHFSENKREIRRMLRRYNVDVFEEEGMIRAFGILDESGYFN